MENLIQEYWWLFLLLAAWTLPWKGVALWKAAHLGQKIWFVALLLLNTVGLLEIIYIFFVARKMTTAVAEPAETELTKIK